MLVEDPPLIRAVRVVDAEQQIVEVTWRGGPRVGKEDTVDLSQAIESRRHYYRLLLARPQLFLDVSVVDGGAAIAWFNASITMSAEVVESLVPKGRVTDPALLYDAALDAGFPPEIDSVSPMGSVIPGDLVTITGKNLSLVIAIYIDDVPVRTFTIISDTTVTAVVGP